jgi:hypothetical protein
VRLVWTLTIRQKDKPPRPHNEDHIVVLGDSLTYGYGIALAAYDLARQHPQMPTLETEMSFEIIGHKPGLEGSFVRAQAETATTALRMARQWAQQGLVGISITNAKGESYDLDSFDMIASTKPAGSSEPDTG